MSAAADDGLAAAGDVRPIVALPGSGVPGWLIAAAMLVAGILLFAVLDARRQALSAPPVRPGAYDRATLPATIVPLAIPPAPVPAVAAGPLLPAMTPIPRPSPSATRIVPTAPLPQVDYAPPRPALPAPSVATPPRASEANTPVLVIDMTTGSASVGPSGSPVTDGAAAAAAAAVHTSSLGQRSTTIAQGTLIPAVLETALDSTRAGLARALVQRDVRGFDGTRVLIPRGSQLVGEYRADLQPGQNRAQVMWTRLVRPDGVTIAIGSPAADTLGRTGIRGKVNSHFLAKFGASILQSTLDVGVGLASRIGSGNSALVLALPGTLNNTNAGSPLATTSQVPPTLRVRQGTAISVFVARDLSFAGVEALP